jgi:hypothetical protein
MQLIPPPPVLTVDEDDDFWVTEDEDAGITALGKTAVGIGLAVAAVGAGILFFNAVRDSL